MSSKESVTSAMLELGHSTQNLGFIFHDIVRIHVPSGGVHMHGKSRKEFFGSSSHIANCIDFHVPLEPR